MKRVKIAIDFGSGNMKIIGIVNNKEKEFQNL